MFEKKHMAPFAIAVMVLMLCGASVCLDADATGEDLTGYGDVKEVSIAPGYTWSYTPTYKADLQEGTTISIVEGKNELKGYTEILSGKTLQVGPVPASLAGSSYNIVLKAYHEDSEQTAYQWIRITVNSQMSVGIGTVSDIVIGSGQTITVTPSGGAGTVSLKIDSTEAPGMELTGDADSGYEITGTPTKVGPNKIVLTATDVVPKGTSQTITKEITFTVYNKIVGDGTSQTIDAIDGKEAKSDPVDQKGDDLNVTWATTDTIPADLKLDAATGVISGTYTGSETGTAVITLTGTTGEDVTVKQIATRTVTINYEPSFSIGAVDKVLTYKDNENTVERLLSIAEKHSAITWSIPDTTGFSIDQDGKLTVTGEAAVCDDGSITVTAESAFGQTKTVDVGYLVEDTLAFNEDAAKRLVGIAGKAAYTEAYTFTGGSGNTLTISDAGTYQGELGSSVSITGENKLYLNHAANHDEEEITLTVKSDAGQHADLKVKVIVYSALSFEFEPSAVGIFALAE